MGQGTRAVTLIGTRRRRRTRINRRTFQWNSERRKQADARHFNHAIITLTLLVAQARVLLPVDLLVPVTTVARWATKNPSAGPSMVAQVHVVLLRPCRLLILRSLGLHLLLLLPCQLLRRETDQGNGCTCCCQTVAVPLVFVSSWGTWQQHCCVVRVACDCQ